MSFLYKFVKSCLYRSCCIITITPTSHHITHDLFLLFLNQLDIEPPSFLLQNTLIQNDSAFHVVLVLLEDSPAYEFSLPKFRIILNDLNHIFEEGVIDTVRVTFFEVIFNLLDPFLKVLGGIKFEIQLSSKSDLSNMLIFL